MSPSADLPQQPITVQKLLRGAAHDAMERLFLNNTNVAIHVDDIERLITDQQIDLLRRCFEQNIPIVVHSPPLHAATPHANNEVILQNKPDVRLRRIDDGAKLRLMDIALRHDSYQAIEILLNAQYPMRIDQLQSLMHFVSKEQPSKPRELRTLHGLKCAAVNRLIEKPIQQGNLMYGTSALTPEGWQEVYGLLLQSPQHREYAALLLKRGVQPSAHDARQLYQWALEDGYQDLLDVLIEYKVPCEWEMFHQILQSANHRILPRAFDLLTGGALTNRQGKPVSSNTLTELYGWMMDESIHLQRRGVLLEVLLHEKIPLDPYLERHPDHYAKLLRTSVSADQPCLLKHLFADSAGYRAKETHSVDFPTLLLQARSAEMVGTLKHIYQDLPQEQRHPPTWRELVQHVMGVPSSMEGLVTIAGRSFQVMSCNLAQLELIKAEECLPTMTIADARLHGFRQKDACKSAHQRDLLIQEQAQRLFTQLGVAPHTCLDDDSHRRVWMHAFVQTVAEYQPWMLQASYPGRAPHPMMTHAVRQAGALYDAYQHDYAPSFLQRIIDCLKTMIGLTPAPPSQAFLTQLEPAIRGNAMEHHIKIS